MIENNQDKIGWKKHDWKGNGFFFWNKLKRKFIIRDPLDRMRNEYDNICFTWCNNESNKNRIYCILDRVYVNAIVFDFAHTPGINPMVVSPASISYHSTIHVCICLKSSTPLIKSQRGKSLFKLNTSLLHMEDTMDAIKIATSLSKFTLHGASPRAKWEQLVVVWKKLFKIIGNYEAIDRKEENFYQRKLNDMEKEMQDERNDCNLEK